MKNNIKKIIVGIFTFVLLFVAQSVFATSIWNTSPNDCPDINIANYTTGVGYGSPCWNGTNINANPGDIINVKVYYHNTSNSTATNTHIKLIKSPSGSSTNYTFTGQILSPQGNLYSSPVYLNIATSQTLTLNSVKWFPNQGSNSVPLLNGQSGSEILGSNGLYIGDIAPGWGTQGTVVAVFKVGNTQPASCEIKSFTANPSSITLGGFSKLSWSTTNCVTTKLFAGSTLLGNFGPSGFLNVYPTTTTTYTLKAYGTNGNLGDTDYATVNVNTLQMTGEITAGMQSCVIPSEGSTCGIPFTWSTQNPIGTSSVTNNGVTVATGNNGNQTFNVHFGPQTYYLYNNSILLDSANVETSCASGSSWNGSKCAPVVVDSCNISFFTANPTTVLSGEASTLSWFTTNCTKVVFSGGNFSGVVGSSGTKIVHPTQTTIYTLKANGLDGIIKTKTVTVGVKSSHSGCTIKEFKAYPTSINRGAHSTLNWSTVDCIKITISNIDSVVVPTSGSKTVYPTQTTTYTIKAYGQNGEIQTRNVTVVVNDIIPTICTINNFTANPTNISQGESSILTWNTSNCTNVILDGIGQVSPSHSRSVWPTQTTTYKLTAYSTSNSIPQISYTTVYVNSNTNNCSISHFYADPSSIDEGESSILRWETNNCTSVSIDGIGMVQNSGSKIVYPTDTKTYILRAYSQSSYYSITEQTTVYVDENSNSDCSIDSFTASDTSIDEGDETNLKWRTSNCDRVKITDLGYVDDDGDEDVSPNEDTTYVLTAYDYDGSTRTDSIRIYVDEDGNNDDDCTINSFTSSDEYVSRGDRITLKWRTTDCDDVRISDIGYVDDDGEEDIRIYETTTYTIRGSGNGSDSDSLKIYVDYYDNDPIYNTNVVTTVATNISQTAAQLNGLITNSNYTNSNTYFEYGTSINLGLRTSSRTTTGTNTFSEYVTGLNPNTIYYFRAVGENSEGISRGAIEIFRTIGTVNNGGGTIIREVVVQGKTVYGTESPIMLRIENKYQTIRVGDIMEYVVFYKNIGNSTLTNPMVQVFMPKGINLTNASRGTYSTSDRTLSVPMNDLSPNEEGVIYIQAKVDSLDANLAQIVTTAVLIYTNQNGAQENAMAYVLNNPNNNGNVLGASAFFGKIFGMGLIGWLLFIIFILLLILIARSFYRNRSGITISNNHQ